MSVPMRERKLMTTEEVAEYVGVTARKVRDLEIPFVKIGKLRRYDPRDVEQYMTEQKQCPSPKGQDRPIITANSKSGAIGFAEAVKQATAEQRRRSNENLKPKQGASLKDGAKVLPFRQGTQP